MTENRSSTPEEKACLNTDREIYRAPPGDYYADSVHVTEDGALGINCGGMVHVRPLREWHRLAEQAMSEKGEVLTPFKAIGYVDHEGTVHWEPGRKPTKEMMLYVADGKRHTRDASSHDDVGYYVSAQFARQLERELAEARRLGNLAADNCDEALERAEEAVRQRDTWQQIADQRAIEVADLKHDLSKARANHSADLSATLPIPEGCAHEHTLLGYSRTYKMGWCDDCGKLLWCSDGLIPEDKAKNDDYGAWCQRRVVAWGCEAEAKGRAKCSRPCGHCVMTLRDKPSYVNSKVSKT